MKAIGKLSGQRAGNLGLECAGMGVCIGDRGVATSYRYAHPVSYDLRARLVVYGRLIVDMRISGVRYARWELAASSIPTVV